jgi:hypothetical protein
VQFGVHENPRAGEEHEKLLLSIESFMDFTFPIVVKIHSFATTVALKFSVSIFKEERKSL